MNSYPGGRLIYVDNSDEGSFFRGLRIADGYIMPRVATGNTVVPSVIISERVADILRAQYGFGPVGRLYSAECGANNESPGFGCALVRSTIFATMTVAKSAEIIASAPVKAGG